MLAEEQKAVERGGHEEKSKLGFPMPFQTLAQDPADHAATDQPGRPARMKNIEVVRAIVREKRGDQRIGNRFERAIGYSKDERAPIKEMVSDHLRLPGRGGKSD